MKLYKICRADAAVFRPVIIKNRYLCDISNRVSNAETIRCQNKALPVDPYKMTEENKRRHPRLSHRARLNLFLEPGRCIGVTMRDFSDSGLYLLYPEAAEADLGHVYQVQTTEFPDAPIRSIKVMRIEPGLGLGVEFIDC